MPTDTYLKSQGFLMQKQIITAVITAALLALGLSSPLAHDVATAIYCNIRPADCEGK